MQNLPSRIAILSLLAGALACGGEEETQEEPFADALADACEHLAEASTAITAAESLTDALPTVSDHTHYTITLAAVQGGNGGYVELASEGGELVVVLDRDIAIDVRDPSGSGVAIEQTMTAPEACSAAQVAYVLDLSVGSHTIGFAPGQQSTVQLVIVATADGEEH